MLSTDSVQYKKDFFLLCAVVMSWNYLDSEDRALLYEEAANRNAKAELAWTIGFVEKIPETAYERARAWLKVTLGDYPADLQRRCFHDVWQFNQRKGYVTEMEAVSFLRLAQDFDLEQEMARAVRRS